MADERAIEAARLAIAERRECVLPCPCDTNSAIHDNCQWLAETALAAADRVAGNENEQLRTALQKCVSVFEQLADAGNYPLPLYQNGGWKFACDALAAAGDRTGVPHEGRDGGEQYGTTACPICGKNEPHYHAPEEDHRRIVAWVCELAHANAVRGNSEPIWSDWRPSLTFDRPNVPAGSIRNLRPLYATPLVSPGKGEGWRELAVRASHVLAAVAAGRECSIAGGAMFNEIAAAAGDCAGSTEGVLLEAIDPGCTDMTEEPASSDADQYWRKQAQRREAAKVIADRILKIGK